jgi:iron complex outermembrane recepter protein
MKKRIPTILILFFINSSCLFSQTIVSGKLVNKESEPLSNASVFLNNNFATSKSDGSFSIKATSKDSAALKITFLGFDSYQVNLKLNNSKVDLGTIQMISSSILTQEVNIISTRSNRYTPITATEISKEEIRRANFGQDMPYLMNMTPSIVVSSDAGNGIGYTNLRLRGSDLTRINVTINGVPLNDSESQGVFFVDLPDLASSTESIQIQRGVGTSTNGAGAFGGSISIQTNNIITKPCAEANITFGSYNSSKLSASVNTGLLNSKWLFESRLSKIYSAGYIDRAASNLKSYYLSASYFGEKSTVKIIHFNGKEITYQSWYGTPQSRVKGDKTAMLEHAQNNYYSEEQTINLLEAGRQYNYYQYKNQVDNYGQAHYQLLYNQYLNEYLKFNLTGHYTKGKGYFEEYKFEQDLADYGFQTTTELESNTDLVRRRWLDNDFYGAVYSLNYTKQKLDMIFGGSINEYDGNHFGEIIWAKYLGNLNTEQRYYLNQSKKIDLSNFLRANYRITDNLSLYADIQFRNIQYQGNGIDNDQRQIAFDQKFNFFNPKFGLNYILNQNNSFYASFSRTSHEPIRSDFVDSPLNKAPKSEKLNNLEVGYKKIKYDYNATINFYLMDYQNQLVPTGALNDVGSAIRVNTKRSFRRGVEFELSWITNRFLSIGGNISLSQNKINNFSEVIYNYSYDGTTREKINFYRETDIAFSPNFIAGAEIKIKPISQIQVGLSSKYVGKQFLDNTSNTQRIINAYFNEDIRVVYSPKINGTKGIDISCQINNVLNTLYENNGYTYSYQYEYKNNEEDTEIQTGEITENFYYPQAEINFMFGLNIKF